MDYETIDWDHEAQRIKRAFGINDECQFIENGEGRDFVWLDTEGRMDVTVSYTPDLRFYALGRYQFHSYPSSVFLRWDGQVDSSLPFSTTSSDRCSPKLARALFNLDLFTTEVESALDMEISAHERAEWFLERERLMRM